MATNPEIMLQDITQFYPFNGKSILHVGAGGGSLAGYACGAQRVIAVDTDAAALERLRGTLRKRPELNDLFEFRCEDFAKTREHADVVYFEFCLHELSDPSAALEHARTLAADVVIVDHTPDSPWAHLGAEEKKLELSWLAIRRFPARKRVTREITQLFRTFQELEGRLGPQPLGAPSLGRLARYCGRSPINIRMPYELVLI